MSPERAMFDRLRKGDLAHEADQERQHETEPCALEAVHQQLLSFLRLRAAVIVSPRSQRIIIAFRLRGNFQSAQILRYRFPQKRRKQLVRFPGDFATS